MAISPRFTNVLAPSPVRTANLRTPRLTATDALIGVVEKFVDDAHNSLDMEAVRKAKAEGAKAGSKEGFVISPFNTLTAQAFNKAGIETFLNKTKVTTDKNLSALLLDPRFASNPVEYENAAIKVIDDIMKDMPLEAIPNYQIYADSKINEFSSRAATNQVEMALEVNKATFEEASTNSIVQISNAAENGDLVALAREQAIYARNLENQGPLINGGTGVLTPEQIVERTNDMFRRTRENLVLGAFRRTPNDGKLEFITLFRDTEFGESKDEQSGITASGLTADDKRKLEDEMFVDLNNELTKKARVEAEETAAEGEASDAAMLNFYENPLDDSAFATAKKLNPTKADKLINFRNDAFTGDNDEIVNDTFRRLHDGILTNEWLEEALGNGLSGSTYDSFRKKLLDQKVNYPFTSWPAWKDEGGYLDRLDTDVPVKTNFIGKALPNDKNTKIAARIRQEMFDTSAIEWRRFTGGEIKDPPDILHLYNRTLKKILAETPVTEVRTSGSVPTKYIENPLLLANDIENGLISTQKGTKWKEELEKINAGAD